MLEEIGRPPPLHDWEKALMVVSLRFGKWPQETTDEQFAKALARLTDWPLKRAEEAVAEAFMRGVIEIKKKKDENPN